MGYTNSNCTESKNVFFGRVSFFGFEGKNETQSANSICVISHVLVQYSAAASVNDVISILHLAGDVLCKYTYILYYMRCPYSFVPRATQPGGIGDEIRPPFIYILYIHYTSIYIYRERESLCLRL